MNQIEKKYMTRTSPLVIEHIESMLQPLPDLSPGPHTLPIQHTTLSSRQQQLFWRYHGHFVSEFVRAIINTLPSNYDFISYDHLQNKLSIQVH